MKLQVSRFDLECSGLYPTFEVVGLNMSLPLIVGDKFEINTQVNIPNHGGHVCISSEDDPFIQHHPFGLDISLSGLRIKSEGYSYTVEVLETECPCAPGLPK